MLFKRWRRSKGISRVSRPFHFQDLLGCYDVFYVCFDEPNRRENWQQVKSLIKKAKKVEGVLGFDRALKQCAQLSQTPHFFVIDGDNWLLPENFREPLKLSELQDDWILSWSAKNPLNGLSYGNGGVKLWPRGVALSMKSHENSSNGSDPTDYCFLVDYYLVDQCLSETRINHSPEQAFRAGFREGVKMSLVGGQQVLLDKDTFLTELGGYNRMRLKVWCNVGADALNGYWAILGARMGLKKNLVEMFPYGKISSLDWVDQLFNKEVLGRFSHAQSVEGEGVVVKGELMEFIEELGAEIHSALNLDMKLLSPEESSSFKLNFQNPSRQGLMRR